LYHEFENVDKFVQGSYGYDTRILRELGYRVTTSLSQDFLPQSLALPQG